MASLVVVSDSNNSSYNGLWSTANGWYRAEAYNLGVTSTTVLSLTTARPISVTFANAGNCQGVVLAIVNSAASDRSAKVDLEEAKAVGSFTVATERVNITTHGFSDGQQVRFTSTGTLPTGITANTLYYVINSTASDFQISTSPGGSVQALSGTPTGTATCWAMRATKTLAYNEIANMNYLRNGGNWLVPFKFVTPYAVDTTASKWRITPFQTGGTTGTLQLKTSDATNPAFVTWCDTAVSFNNDDVPILVDPVAINASISTGAILGTGDTVFGVGGWVCRSSDAVTPNLTWVSNPAASYTWTVKGVIFLGAHSRVKFGYKHALTGIPAVGSTSATLSSVWTGTTGTYTIHFPSNSTTTEYKNVTLTNGSAAISWSGGLTVTVSDAFIHVGIPVASKAVLTFNAATVGTIIPQFLSVGPITSGTTYEYGGKMSLEIYGEIPSVMKTTLASDAASGQKDLVTTDTTGWAITDRFVIGKSSVMGADNTVYTIGNISGTTITTTVNITNTRLTGASVFRLGGMGVEITGQSNYIFQVYGQPSKIIVRGVYVKDASFYGSSNSSYLTYKDDLANRAQFQFTDICTESTSTSSVYLVNTFYVPEHHMIFQRVYAFRRCCGITTGSLSKIYTGLSFASGWLYNKDCVIVQKYINVEISSTTNIKYVMDNFSLEHTNYGGVYVAGTNSSITNSSFWGQNSVSYNTYGTLMVQSPVNFTASGNKIDACQYGYVFYAGASINCKSVNDEFGQTTANLYDIGINAAALIDFTFQSPVGTPTIDITELADTVLGSQVRFVDNSGITNNDSDILTYGKFQRCGTGLSDTTVRTAGGYSLRFEPLSSTERLEWNFNIPTGNIQNQSTIIGLWVKINSTSYWAGTHQMPRITINYDNGTESYGEAAQTTDWQYIHAVFTPTTTFGQVTVTLSGMTDATTTDSYIYWDDFSGGFLVNTTLDGWANAEPIPPAYSFNINAATFWDYSSSSATASGSMGVKLKKVLTLPQFMGLK